MADVVITLSLTRRSGMLAAAVSAVSRAGLDFRTHRYVDAGEGHQIELRAESDDAFGDPRPVVDELSEIRGVAAVDDVVVDGTSWLHAEPEPEEVAESEPETVTEQDETAAPEAIAEVQPVEASSENEGEDEEPDVFAETEPRQDAQPDYESGWEQATADGEASRDQAASSGASAEGPKSSDYSGRSRLSMIRRRRRRR